MNSLPEEVRIRVLGIYSALGFAAISTFGLFHIIDGNNPRLGYLQLVIALVIALNFVGLRITKNLRLALAGFLLALLVMLMVVFLNGGINNKGVFWFFFFPIIAFFLTGRLQGLLWTIGLFLATISATIYMHTQSTALYYSFSDIGQLLTILFFVTAGIYVYEQVRERLQSKEHESRQDFLEEKVKADAILANIDEGVVTTDNEGKVMTINKPALAMLGWTKKEMIGKSFISLVPSIDKRGDPIKPKDRILSKVLEEPELSIASSNSLFQRRDGSTFPVAVLTRSMLVDGRVVGAIGTFRDITKESEIDHAKSEFVTLASHQLRTPISAISWATELLLHGDAGELTDNQRESIEQIYASNQRSADTVEAMLIVSTIEMGSRLPVRPEAVQLKPFIHVLLRAKMKQLLGTKKIDVREQYASDVPALQLDIGLAKTIIQNVLSNAIKYTPSGGKVTVDVSLNDKKLTPGSEGSVQIIVTDTGYGIPESEKDRIYEKMFRGSNIRTKDTDGIGLGLYIVRHILEQVGGEMSFVSQQNTGSTFTIYLPLEGMRPNTGMSQDKK